MSKEMSIEETIEILLKIRKGDIDCLTIDKYNSLEDIEHWDKEIEAIENFINNYNKEKAKADKLEKEYSKMLTKIDEYEVENEANKKRIEELEEENVIYRKQLNSAFDRGFIHKDKIIREMKNARKRINPYEIYKKESRYYWLEQGAISLCERLLNEEDIDYDRRREIYQG